MANVHYKSAADTHVSMLLALAHISRRAGAVVHSHLAKCVMQPQHHYSQFNSMRISACQSATILLCDKHRSCMLCSSGSDTVKALLMPVERTHAVERTETLAVQSLLV
jgi:hypothetical protein